MNGEQSVRIVYISKAWAIDTIQTFWKRKIGAPGLGRIIYPAPQIFFRSWNSCPGTDFAQFGSARPCHWNAVRHVAHYSDFIGPTLDIG